MLPSSRTLHIGGSIFSLYEIHHELLLMVFIYFFPHKNGTSGVFYWGGINNA